MPTFQQGAKCFKTRRNVERILDAAGLAARAT